MKISDVSHFMDNTKIKNDGEFEACGLINTNISKKIISFIENKKYIQDISEDISCIFIKKELYEFIPKHLGIIICENPRAEFYKLHNSLCNNCKDYFREKYKTTIGVGSKISEKSIISKYNVTIGENVTIEENVIIRENVIIGNDSIIRAGSIIGGEGFLFNRTNDDKIIPGNHAGGVLIGKDVEIQYNCCVDKAIFPWDYTIIGDSTKTDNLVHIGHAVKIGKRCLFPANSVIGGYTVIGDDSWIGVGATVSNNIIIGDKCRISIGAVATKNVESRKTVSGNFAIEHSKFLDFIRKIR
ncbi:UDP-3-O-(3-hydroxymyristoyl)glucosamine N-acyltransferase [Clostridium tyrobutyricum]|uniref:UDP-3-O-(3-hydroxymyristoyl)glucosamine N-acyltransferase n=1 Tax=Clostridium tyrobutyricum TaxID=1519 RepID=UPI001C38A1B3|nr:UDP-3-O-(3-hydroxymyristoyl)glucosamine N-acyltransferase [Clostridium tyrobutyricum]MBV4441701.1 UDP-3-O-(3-hydroxymyristoyl)glucosamine N-acyltransferase [Clostridium tyrobutyricum]